MQMVPAVVLLVLPLISNLTVDDLWILAVQSFSRHAKVYNQDRVDESRTSTRHLGDVIAIVVLLIFTPLLPLALLAAFARMFTIVHGR
eukprot:6451196-Amphidinium_carterae.1